MHRFSLLLIAALIGPAYFFAQAHHSLYAQNAFAQNAFAQNAEQRLILSATSVLRESIQRPGGRIPEKLLSQSHGVAIIPNVIKGGFVVGAKHGRGLLFIREPNGVWRAPTFISLTGGNIGWQVGDSDWLLFGFANHRWVVMTPTKVNKAADVTEYFTEGVGAMPRDGERADPAGTVAADCTQFWVLRDPVILLNCR